MKPKSLTIFSMYMCFYIHRYFLKEWSSVRNSSILIFDWFIDGIFPQPKPDTSIPILTGHLNHCKSTCGWFDKTNIWKKSGWERDKDIKGIRIYNSCGRAWLVMNTKTVFSIQTHHGLQIKELRYYISLRSACFDHDVYICFNFNPFLDGKIPLINYVSGHFDYFYLEI